MRRAIIFGSSLAAVIALAYLWPTFASSKVHGHQNLLDCYRDRHGETCELCTAEALLARQMSQRGSMVAQIRDAIRQRLVRRN
jgi:hypothetical protein